MIKEYGKLMIPVSLLEKITEHGMLVDTTWTDDGEVLSSVKSITEVRLYDQKDIDDAKVQMALEGKSE